MVANLSRFLQVAELDLGEYRDFIPVEMVGRTAVRPTTDGRLTLTLGPHSIFWFSLERLDRGDVAGRTGQAGGCHADDRGRGRMGRARRWAGTA